VETIFKNLRKIFGKIVKKMKITHISSKERRNATTNRYSELEFEYVVLCKQRIDLNNQEVFIRELKNTKYESIANLSKFQKVFLECIEKQTNDIVVCQIQEKKLKKLLNKVYS